MLQLLRGPVRSVAKLAVPFLIKRCPAVNVRREIELQRRRRVQPRLNSARFPNGQPETVPTDTVRVLRFLAANNEQLTNTMRLLADEPSRKLLTKILAYRALGPRHVALPALNDNPLDLLDDAKACAVSEPKGEFNTQVFRVNGLKVEAWSINIWADFFERQYYFERGGIRIQPEDGDVVIDAGACFGDTALAFAQSVGPRGHVHSFEPMPRQAEVFARNLATNPDISDRITLHGIALSDAERTLSFDDRGAASHASTDGVSIGATTIDAFAASTGVAPTFIKMDIEGAEPAALRGSACTLRKFRPKLAISAYHSLDDLVGLAPLIHRIEPSYQFYLDHHTTHDEETVLYAIAPVRSSAT